MIRVLHVLRAPDGTTGFVDLMAGAKTPDVSFLWFTWPAAYLSRYDVLHIHFPEYLFRHRTRTGTLVKSVLTLGLLARTSVAGVRIVRTKHNERPHEPGSRFETRMLRWIDSRTNLWIVLNEATSLPRGARAVLVPHGHYRGRHAVDASPSTPGTLLFFGLLRKYKGVERLLEVFAEMTEPELSLRIVGNPMEDDTEAAVRDACLADHRVTARLEFVSDADLGREIGQAELVVLPYLEMHNSGAVLAALSAGRPVLVPDTAPNVALADEVGPGWIHLYSGELTAERVEGALADVRTGARDEPDLSGRDWERVGELLAVAYRDVLTERDVPALRPGQVPG